MQTTVSRMVPRAIHSAAVAILAIVALFNTPAWAAPKFGAYSVVLTAPLAAAKREIIDGAIWRCQADQCSAPANGERLLSLCSTVSRKFGQVASFTAPQGALSAEDLSRCNKR
jgi:hypothetical protein